ncbi:MAG: hypothetical protein R2716_00595 [Microthrixaceae bacterium]
MRAFVAKLVQTPEQKQVAQLVARGDEASLRAALEVIPDDPEAVMALASLLLASGGEDATEEVLALLERLPESAETRHLASLARAGGRPEGGDAAVEAELAELLGSVKADDDARARFVDLLEVLGDDDAHGLAQEALGQPLLRSRDPLPRPVRSLRWACGAGRATGPDLPAPEQGRAAEPSALDALVRRVEGPSRPSRAGAGPRFDALFERLERIRAPGSATTVPVGWRSPP